MSGAYNFARFCRAYFRVAFAIILEYRATVFIWLLAGLTPIIMMFVWRHLASDGPIGTRDPKAFSCYFLLAFLSTQCCMAWVVWNVDYRVRTGAYAIQLLRPYDPWFAEVIENIAANGLRLPSNLVVVALGLTFTGSWDLIMVDRLPAYVLTLLLAWQLMFNMNYALALLCLWVDRAKSVDSWIYVMLFSLGGSLFPLDLLPTNFQSIVNATPFPWMVNFPVAVVTGGAEPGNGLIMQSIWLCVFVVAHRILWVSGRKRFGVVGG